MNKISKQQIDKLCNTGRCIDFLGGYPSVIIHPDDTVTKIWAQKKRLFTSNSLYSYSQRFVNNAAKLKQRGIIVPEILGHARLEGSHIRIVKYRALPGNSIRDLLKNSPASVDIPDLSRYVYSLHEKGILFRSIHFGNIIQLPEKGYGLIDFTDVKFSNNPVPLLKRAANIAFPLRYTKDAQRIKKNNLPSFLESYLALLNLNKPTKKQFKKTYTAYKKL